MMMLMTIHVYPIRSVFPISFDCLDSHVAGPEDDADDEHVGSRSFDE